RALVLSNTAAPTGTPAMWQARIEAIQQGGLSAYADSALQRILGPQFQTNPHAPYLRDLLIRTNPDGWIGCASAIAGSDFYTTTASLRLPTLAIAGANDGTTPPDLVRETAELIPGHRFALMRGVGHLPMVERPGEYAALLADFLRQIGHG
ncbi:MAG: 3-oxoadipate enol-lactonase, partial [Candidatus Saccharibacteria bacterium]|nr:3-oxoadipate enol-lactonase [Pseudorhodobacter sp.]